MTDDNKIENSLIPIGSTGLVRVGNSIDITNKILLESREQELFSWWNLMSNEWQLIFRLQIGLFSNNVSYNALKKITKLNNLSCSNIKIENGIFTSFTPQIYDLTPIKKLNELRVFSCCAKKLNGINQLSHLLNLEKLWLSWSTVEDLTPLDNLLNLKELYLQGTKVKTLKPLMKLKSLNYLSVIGVDLPTSEIEEFKFINPSCKIFA